MNEAPRRNVTVVDYSPDVLTLLGDVLRSDGFKVSLLDGATTFMAIVDSQPDVLVIDWRLGTGSLNGGDIIREARSNHALRAVPIIVCSAALDELEAVADELAQVPQLYILNKPFSLEELEACVGQALNTNVRAVG